MLASIAASAVAADALGYHGAATVIRERELGPQAIAKLFAYGLARDCGRVCAVVLLAGATARHHACPEGWNGDVERGLAEQALRPRNISLWQGGRPAQAADQAAWNKLAKKAAEIVGKHWDEISAAASPAWPPRPCRHRAAGSQAKCGGGAIVGRRDS
jgi:hypothetical protein